MRSDGLKSSPLRMDLPILLPPPADQLRLAEPKLGVRVNSVVRNQKKLSEPKVTGLRISRQLCVHLQSSELLGPGLRISTYCVRPNVGEMEENVGP